VCYADDTLVVASGGDWCEAARRAEAGVALVVRRIEMLGLKMAPQKTEALGFHGPRLRPPPSLSISIQEVNIEVGSSMKYLGLVLDSRWAFGEHFARLGRRLRGERAWRASSPIWGPRRRDTPPLRGGGELYSSLRCPRLVERPEGPSTLPGRSCERPAANGPQGDTGVPHHRPGGGLGVGRHSALGIRGRGAGRDAQFSCECPRRGAGPSDAEGGEFSPGPRLGGACSSAGRGRSKTCVVEFLRPVLEDWAERRYGKLTFRLVQVLSDHGCFGQYLHRIPKRERITKCHHCEDPEDTAQHTLEHCPAWTEQRRVLTSIIGEDLSPSAVVSAMLEDERSWNAVASFCEDVLLQKEAARRGIGSRRPTPIPPAERGGDGGGDNTLASSEGKRGMHTPLPRLGCRGAGAGTLLPPITAAQGGRRTLLGGLAMPSWS